MNSPNMLTTFTVDMLTKPSALSDPQLVDQIAELRQIKATLEKREKVLAEAFKSRHEQFAWITPETEAVQYPGNHYICVPTLVVQKRLDTEGLRESFGDDWMEEHSKTISFIQMRFNKADTED
jgi:hypothetical protein